MPVAPMQDILKDAFLKRYGVGAFNIVNDLTLSAVLAAAEEMRSPVIIQVSLKTVDRMGPGLLHAMFAQMAAKVSIPTTLHLDHCPRRDLIEACVAAGWNSVLFDASRLGYADNLAQTTEIVAFAHRHGVAVEGELEAVPGVEDGQGSDEADPEVPLEQALEFVRRTGIDSFAPAIGTAHGLYRAEPRINFQRAAEIVAGASIPLVLHGGTGLQPEVFRKLISLGAIKINIATHLRITYTDALRDHLNAHPTEHEPSLLHGAAHSRVQAMVRDYVQLFGSANQAP